LGVCEVYLFQKPTYPRVTLGSVAFLLAVTLYQGTTSYGISDQLRDAYSICSAAGILLLINGKFTILALRETTRYC
jgi:hypothetical protein